jgi:hypothetical protein
MGTPPPPRLSAAQAEQLLDGGCGTGPLPRLLAAAAGPGMAYECRGEAPARAAFVNAQLDRRLPDSPARRPPHRRSTTSGAIVAKVLAAVALTAGASGGVALAAGATTDRLGPVARSAPAGARPTAGPGAVATTIPMTSGATTSSNTTSGATDPLPGSAADTGHEDGRPAAPRSSAAARHTAPERCPAVAPAATIARSAGGDSGAGGSTRPVPAPSGDHGCAAASPASGPDRTAAPKEPPNGKAVGEHDDGGSHSTVRPTPQAPIREDGTAD